METSFGALDVAAGDYVIIPTSVIHRVVPTGERPLRTLAIESTSHIGPPKRYLSVRGQFLETRRTASGTCAAPANRCWWTRRKSR